MTIKNNDYWSEIERAAIDPLIKDLLQKQHPVQVSRNSTCDISLSDIRRLTYDLSADLRAVVVRRLMECLQFDENAPFTWRMDNKLIQSLIFHEFCSVGIPSAVGLSRALADAGKRDIGAYLTGLFAGGFVIKPVRGYASKRSDVLSSDRTVLNQIVKQDLLDRFDGTPESEIYVVQKKIGCMDEFRVHTLGKYAVPSLIFKYHKDTMMVQEKEKLALIAFVEDILSQLPDCLANAFCAWDIALNRGGTFDIIEANYAGRHPVFQPGFHCSGYLQHPVWGAVNTAQLLLFARNHYGLNPSFNLTGSFSAESEEAADMIYWVEQWLELIDISDRLGTLWKGSFLKRPHKDSSLREMVFLNQAAPMDRRYLEFVDWLHKMTDDIRNNA